MPVLPIIRLGHPLLRTASEPVVLERLGEDAALQALIEDMIETMRVAHGVGLAAPQIGVSRQLFVYQTEPDDDAAPVEAVINPSVEPHAGELVYDWEGCLSIPDLRGLVPRHPAVRLFGFDRHGTEITRNLEGFVARIVQHEYDHLHGVLFLDRMRDLKSLAFEEEWVRYLAGDERSAVG